MSSEKRLNDYDTVGLSESGKFLMIIDQTRLPGELRYLKLRELEDIREAIYMLRVRGAPAIGVAAAIGLYVIADGLLEKGFRTWTMTELSVVQKEYEERLASLAANRFMLSMRPKVALDRETAAKMMNAAILS